MYLIQILLPVFDNEGRRFERSGLATVSAELAERFGGLTAFAQSPAQGLWKDAAAGATEHDEMILVEVMVDEVDREWWQAYRQGLEARFRQDEIVIRMIACDRL